MTEFDANRLRRGYPEDAEYDFDCASVGLGPWAGYVPNPKYPVSDEQLVAMLAADDDFQSVDDESTQVAEGSRTGTGRDPSGPEATVS